MDMVDRLLLDLEHLGQGGVPTPNPSESLPAFYERSRDFWRGEAREALVEEGLEDTLDDEDVEAMLDGDGFVLAKKRYADVRPILERLETTQTQLQRLQDLVTEGAEGGLCAFVGAVRGQAVAEGGAPRSTHTGQRVGAGGIGPRAHGSAARLVVDNLNAEGAWAATAVARPSAPTIATPSARPTRKGTSAAAAVRTH